MSPTLNFAGLALPLYTVLWVATIGLGMLAGRLLARRKGIDVDGLIWRVVVVGLVVARLAFVCEYHSGYFEHPLDIVKIYDGGWEPQAGFMAAWMTGLWMAYKQGNVRKPVLASLGTATLAWACGAIGVAVASQQQPGLSTTKVASTQGQSNSLNDFGGKPLLVNMWATWCPPCRAELPLLQRAQMAHPEYNFVFLNQGESKTAVDSFLAAHALLLKNVMLDNEGQAGSAYGSGALPTTLLFDAKGNLIDEHVGMYTSGSLEQSMDKLRASLAAAQSKTPKS